MNLMFRHGMTPTQRLIWLKRLTGGGDGSILKTVTGTSLHIEDAIAKPAKSFTANLEPEKVTGKNLFNKNDYVKNVGYIDPANDRYVVGAGRITAVLPDPIPVGTYTISRATSARLRAGLVTSTTLTNYQAVTNKVAGTNSSDDPVTITVTESGYYLAIFFKDTADADEQALLDRLQVEKGSYATSYEDYTCTLKGYTGFEVYHSDADTSDPTTIPITFPVLGKNLLDMSDANIEVGKYIDNSGAEKTNASNFYNAAYIPVNASTAYTLSTSSGIKYCSFMEYDENKTFIKRTLYGNGSTPFTTQSHTMGSTTAFVLIGSNPTGSTIDLTGIKAIDWMFNEGSTAQAYEPYNSTVYGGTLTINEDGSGELKVEYDVIENPNITFRDYDNYRIARWVFSGDISKSLGAGISNKFKYATTVGERVNYTYATASVGVCWVYFPNTMSDADIATEMSTAQFVRKLATPITYQLTSQQVITLLQGENNIWCDASDDLELKYYATSE